MHCNIESETDDLSTGRRSPTLVDYEEEGRTSYGLEVFYSRIWGEIHAPIIVGCQMIGISKSMLEELDDFSRT